MAGPISLCLDCQNDLPVLLNSCQQCGIPLADNHLHAVCGQCIQSPPAFDYSVSLYHYETPLDYMISQLKFQKHLSHAAIFAHLLLSTLKKLEDENKLPDAILPVPLHHSRLQKRGFNQSLEIIRPVSKALNIPILNGSIVRSKNTLTQTNLTAQERRKNVKGCFSKVKPIEAQHIVIVDDVVTTGSTCNELAIVLKDAAVKKVGVWSIARAKGKT